MQHIVNITLVIYGINMYKGIFKEPYSLWNNSSITSFRNVVGDKFAKIIYGVGTALSIGLGSLGILFAIIDWV